MEEQSKGTGLRRMYSRMPQSLVFDNKAISRQFIGCSAIIQDLVVFYTNRKLNFNLFGELEFTMSEFCEEMGYNRTYLQRTMDLENVPMIDGHAFDSPFEFALFRGLNEVMIVHQKKQDCDEFLSYRLFEKMSVNYDKSTNKRVKRSYSIKLAEEFLDAMLNNYFVLNYNEYARLTSRNVDTMEANRNFYLVMCKMIAVVRNQRYNARMKGEYIDANVVNVYKTNVDILCSQLNIDIKDPKNKKRALNNRLKLIQSQLINTPFEFQYVKVNNNGKGEYGVNIYFPDDVLDDYDERLKAKFMYKLIQHCTTTYSKVNERYRYLMVNGKLTEKDRMDFQRWFTSPQNIEDTRIISEGQVYTQVGKFSIFKTVYQEIYGDVYPGDKIDFSLLFRAKMLKK